MKDSEVLDNTYFQKVFLAVVLVVAFYLLSESVWRRKSVAFPVNKTKKTTKIMNFPPAAPMEVENEEAVKMLLKIAREEIGSGTEDPTQALSALLHAIRLTQGEEAITTVLDNAKKQAEKENPDLSDEDMMKAAQRMTHALITNTSTLLYEQGNETILKDAFEDGSSVVCSSCEALVPRSRFRQHQAFWCEVTAGKDSDEDG